MPIAQDTCFVAGKFVFASGFSTTLSPAHRQNGRCEPEIDPHCCMQHKFRSVVSTIGVVVGRMRFQEHHLIEDPVMHRDIPKPRTNVQDCNVQLQCPLGFSCTIPSQIGFDFDSIGKPNRQSRSQFRGFVGEYHHRMNG